MNIPLFPDGARVVFAGDSITNANKYLSHIVEYYRKHLTDRTVQFFNCGIAGCGITELITLFDRDIMYYDPTHIVLTIGVNDSGLVHLKEKNKDTYNLLTGSYERYKANLERFAEICKSRNIILSFGTTFPYAEYQQSGTTLYHGGYALVQKYADAVRAFAEKNGYAYCDYHPYLTREMMFKKLYDDDHIHPNALGHYYIAKCFLESQGFTLDTEELSPEVEEWNRRTLAIRDVFTGLYKVIGIQLSIDEAKVKAEKIMADNAAAEKPDFYRVTWAGKFLNAVDDFDENREWVKNFNKV